MNATYPQAKSGKDSVRWLFRFSLYVKGADSLLELFLGTLALIVPGQAIIDFARTYTHHAFLIRPDDAVARWIMQTADSLAVHHATAAAVFLLSHGVVKLFLVVMLLRNKEWAYPVFIVVLAGLITYQIYQLSVSIVYWLLFLTIFDVIVLFLTWHEYRLRRVNRATT